MASKQQTQQTHTTKVRDSNKNLQTELLVNGYCRRIQKLLKAFNYIIPLPIIELCLKFYEITAIINVTIGQYGNQLMLDFYKSILEEYNVDFKTGRQQQNDTNKTSYIGNTYLRKRGSIETLRCISIDLEPGTLEIIKPTEISKFIPADNYCFGACGAGNNWAKGHYTEGAELIDEAMYCLQREIEQYDEPQCIQFMHSIGGGTGSGMGTLMMGKTKEMFPNMKVISFTGFPCSKVGDVVVEPYNATLSLNCMAEHIDGTFLFDEEALWNMAHNTFKMRTPRYNDLNFISTQMINDVTSLFRYNDSYGFNVNLFLDKMVKYPNLKYFTCSRAPFYTQKNKILNGESYDDTFVLTKRLFDKKRCFAGDMQQGTNLSTVILYRGFHSDNKEIVKTVQDVEETKFDDDIISTVIKYKPLCVSESAAMIANSTSIKAVFQRISSQFAKMYRRKAFLHWYKGEGMDEMEFEEAAAKLKDLITEYQLKETK